MQLASNRLGTRAPPLKVMKRPAQAAQQLTLAVAPLERLRCRRVLHDRKIELEELSRTLRAVPEDRTFPAALQGTRELATGAAVGIGASL
jgi:hypothetical protein